MPHAFVRLVVTPNEGREDALAQVLGADEKSPNGRDVFSRVAPVRLPQGRTLDDLSESDRARFCRHAWSCGPDPLIVSSTRNDDDTVTIVIRADRYPNRFVNALSAQVAVDEAGADGSIVFLAHKSPRGIEFQVAVRRPSLGESEEALWRSRAEAVVATLPFPAGAREAFEEGTRA